MFRSGHLLAFPVKILFVSIFCFLFLLAPVFVQAEMAADDDDDDDSAPLEKRTLYVIGSHSGFISFPLMAWIIVGDDIYLADTWQARTHDTGAGGLAVDETNENLFVSYEGYGGLEVFDARDATPLGTITLFGTTNLAGIVVHQDRGELYVVDRGQTTVYVFDTTNFNLLDQWTLTNTAGAWGLDLLGDWLFVTDTSNTIRYYDITTKSEVGSFTQGPPAVGIVVADYPEPVVYTGASIGANSNFVTQYFLNSGVENHLNIGNDVKGLSLNPALDMLYISTGNKVMVIDTAAFAILRTKNLSFTWSPCDVLASFVPFGGTVKKTCSSHPNGKILKGQTVVFNVAIQNRHPLPIHEMKVQDDYDTTQLTFVSANPPTDDNNDDGVLNWSDVIGQLGADLQTGEWAEIEVTFTALEDCEGEVLEGINTATMYDVKDTEGTSLPDAIGIFEYEIDCNCKTNLDCDDSVFCNGAEICKADGTCESPGNPCPLDDGLYCNGTETEVCDEDMDECEHENPPCEDDDKWCNGTEVCNDDTDACTNSGPPCDDDGQFCNGDESCDEKNDQCSHTGDPCPPDKECNESTDSCDASDVTDDDDDTDDGKKDLWPEGKVTGGCCGC